MATGTSNDKRSYKAVFSNKSANKYNTYKGYLANTIFDTSSLFIDFSRTI
jgi:hypothetical protein